MRKSTKRLGLCWLLVVAGCAEYAGPEAKDLGAAGGPGFASRSAALEQPTTSLLQLNITSDTSLRLSAPNQNFGASPSLDVNRGLLKLEPAALSGAVATSDYVVAAKLRLTLVPDNTRRLQRNVAAHRVLKQWTELGATWQCAVDSDVSNRRADCTGATAWTMTNSSAFAATATGTATIPASRTGTVDIDVTADVRAFLAGSTPNYGWLLKTGLGVIAEVADLAARESATPPQLILDVRRCNATLCNDDNACTVDSCDATGTCLHVAASAATSCDDGNACTVNDVCGAGACTPGAAAPAGKTCGEGLVCTASSACTPARIVINEIESNISGSGDWVELYNAGSSPAELSGYRVRDNDDTHQYTVPAGTTLAAGAYLVVEEPTLPYGLGGGDSVRLYTPTNATPVDTYTWTAHAANTYGRCPNGSGAFQNTTTVTKGTLNDCSTPSTPDAGTPPTPTPTSVVINEAESSDANGGGDWVELFNAGTSSVNISGFRVRDNDDTHQYTIPAGTTLAAGAYLVIEEPTLPYGLGGADSVRLYDATAAAPYDTYSWTAHAVATTYGRCPNGTGAFTTTGAVTKGSANNCGTTPPPTPDAGTPEAGGGLAFGTWPGATAVSTVDTAGTFSSNLSGLTYQPAASGSPAVLWAVQNSPSKLFRLLFDGSVWSGAPNSDAEWSAGKTVAYPGGALAGAPDCEGVTKAEWDSPAVYIATERNNSANTVSRLSILRVDTSATGTTLTATHEWNLTADLPVVGPNLGLEAITWIPDTYLVAQGLRVDGTNQLYNPNNYANHGAGLFFVGVEQTGHIYAFALNHTDGSFARIADIDSGLAGVMALEFDRDQSTLWSYCDNTCGNKATVLDIATAAGSSALGHFDIEAAYNRPSGLADINNEGIAIAPESECAGGQKAFYFSDDSSTDGHALRVGSIQCGPLF